MSQYIDKSALVAEIESKIEKYTKRVERTDAKRDGYGMLFWGGVISCLIEVRTLCDTLEVKEIVEEPMSKDLEEMAKAVTKDKESAVKFLKNAGIMDENDNLAELYRSEEPVSEDLEEADFDNVMKK